LSWVDGEITLGITDIALGSTALVLDGLTSVEVTQDPVTNLQLATKQYVDNSVSTGLTFHEPVQAATTASLASITGGTVTYNQPGGAGVGVGATITLSNALTVLDGYTLLNTNRILVKDEVNQTYNGVYTWATGGTVLTRATDADTYGVGPNTLSLNDYFFVQNGTTQANIAYVLNAPVGTITFGTSAITFAEFSRSNTYTGNTPIDVTGTVISLTTVPITLGGTGQVTANAGLNALLPSQTANAGRYLTTDGANSSWSTLPVDPNTTYTYTAGSATGGANLTLTGSDATTNTVKLTNAGHITATYTSATEVTLGSDATDANTANAIVSRDASGNFNASTVSLAGQLISTQANNTADGAGQIFLNGSGGNRIDWVAAGTGAPTTTTRSAGTKAVLYPALSGSQTDYALGIDSATLWSSVPVNSDSFKFKWYGATTEVGSLSGAGNLVVSGNINSAGATLGNVTVGVATDNTISTTTGDLILDSTTGLIQLNNTALQSTVAQTWTVLDNNASALSIDATGKTGILKVISTDGSEGVTMSGTLGVTGAVTAGTLSRVLGQQINTRNSTYTPPTIPLTAVTGLNGLAVASSTGGYFPDISVNNYLTDTSSGNNGAGVSLRSTSGTSASPTGTANNQIMGTVNFDGWATGTNANWASYTSTVAGGIGGGVSYVYPLQAQAYARQAFTNGTVSTAVTGASGNGTTATLTFAQLNVQTYFANGVITVAGMTPSGYNGTYTITAATTTSVSYLNATTGFTSGGTISIPAVSAAGTGYRIRGFQTSTPLIGANRINFADFNASSTTFKSAAYTFINEVIPGATQTATTYLTLGSGGSTFNQTTGSTTINNSTMINNDLTVKSTSSGTTLSTSGDVVYTQTQYSTSPFTYPLRISGKRTDNVNPQNDDTTGYQFQLFGSGSNFVNLGSMSIKYKTSGDNSIEFFVDNNAGPNVSTNPMTVSAPQTVIRAGTNASVSAVVTVNPTNVTFAQPIKFPAYTAATANTITGAVGWQISISDSPVNGGKMAYWDTTNNRWSYIDTNLAV
jgi:hypothetical protein